MTDTHDPLQPDPLDDLASAHLDGQTTDAEAARIAADPSLAERVARMAAVRAAVQSDGPAVDEGRRETSIAAALAAFDEASSENAPGDADGGTLTPITAARTRRAVSRRTVRLVGAVAAAVLLALSVPLLGRLDSDPSEDDDLAAKTHEETTADGDASTAAGAQSPEADSTYAMPMSAPMDLGAFDDVTSLEDAVRSQAPLGIAADRTSPTTTAALGAEAALACGEAPPDVGAEVVSGTATLDGRPVLVRVYERPTGDRTIVVVDATDCTVVTTVPL